MSIAQIGFQKMVLKCYQVLPHLKYTRWQKMDRKNYSHTLRLMCKQRDLFLFGLYSYEGNVLSNFKYWDSEKMSAQGIT